jgi:hypothetical protein
MRTAEEERLLQKKWKATAAVMRRALRKLPPPTSAGGEYEKLIGWFNHFVHHNELELAFDQICAAAEFANCRGGVWRDLERAAEFMGLTDRLPYLRKNFSDVPIGRDGSLEQ